LSEQPNLQGESTPTLLKVRRRPPEPRGFFRRMPVSLRYGLPLAVVAVLVAAFWPQICELARSLLPSYARLELLDHQGQPLRHAQLQFFAYDITSFGPSPTRLLSEMELDVEDSGVIELGAEHMPEEAFVRIAATGHGVDFRHLRRGSKKVATAKLGKPMQVSGTVRSVSGQPLEGARVLAIGGGDPRGVLLREVRSDKTGAFTLPDLSDRIRVLVVRVLLEGFGVAEKTWWQEPTHREPLEEEKAKARLDFELRPIPPATGRVLLPEGVPAQDLELRVHQLPGVSAKIDEDGSFTLHHLAKEDATIFRLLVANLPAGYTHPRVLARPGESDVTIPIRKTVTVTGNAVEAGDNQPVTAGLVSHEHGPRGGEQCRLGADGSFRLEHVPPGDIELRVTLDKSKRRKEGGVRIKTVRIGDQSDEQPVVLWIR